MKPRLLLLLVVAILIHSPTLLLGQVQCPVEICGFNTCETEPCLNGGNCTDLINGFICTCLPGYTDRQCYTDIDDCAEGPCVNGVCTDEVDSYSCECNLGYTGTDCDINIDDCQPDSCQNGGSCMDRVNDYTCNCTEGFAGRSCELDSNCPLGSDPCQNNAICVVEEDLSIGCNCTLGYTGELCEAEVDECAAIPCMNNAACHDMVADYICLCLPGYTGEMCETDIDDCASNPCNNDGICVDDVASFDCFCRQGFTGPTCQINIDDCVDVVCENGGECIDGVREASCQCAPGYTGEFCGSQLDPCVPNPCNNGTCAIEGGTYTCSCPEDFTGLTCDIEMAPCSDFPCQNNATCVDDGDDYICSCMAGFTGTECQVDINDCAPEPCFNGATCVDDVDGYECICVDGYNGTDCEIDINECESMPCNNNATCVDFVNDFVCECLPGFTDDFCETDIDECSPSPCHNLATCVDLINEFLCICPNGFTGSLCFTDVPDCEGNPCQNGTCTDLIGGYVCTCFAGYTGDHCSIDIDDCLPNPCQNNGTCYDGIAEYECDCQAGYTGDNCEVEIDHCQPNPCLQQASCFGDIFGYTCLCPIDYTGDNCSIEIDHCDNITCENGATCMDLVGTFECLCSTGYTGQYCETELDACEPYPCHNQATCIDLDTDYLCLCGPGFTGKMCQTDINDCVNVTCVNGICLDGVDNFECLCSNGYTGVLCDKNIDDCSPSPCLNNATCVDEVANFTCVCSDGYSGRRCEIDTDLCDPQPCQNGGSCSDSNNYGYYNCTCPVGFQGLNCETDVNECSENANPCLNGGSCENTFGSFQCLCPDSYTGNLCEMEVLDNCLNLCYNGASCMLAEPVFGSGSGVYSQFMCLCPPLYTGVFCEDLVTECEANSCENGGSCAELYPGYSCQCLENFTGERCETAITVCTINPCFNNASCSLNPDDSFACTCLVGYTGDLCQNDINECIDEPCLNEGDCVNTSPGFYCDCLPNYTGDLCRRQVDLDPCSSSPCSNNATCINSLEGNSFTCNCTPGFAGDDCSTQDCSNEPCLNGGTCGEVLLGIMCTCTGGYTGDMCETGIDPCLPNPCFNNASCTGMLGDLDFVCDCSPGYSGTLCDVDINECDSSPCQNNGTCMDLVAGYDCQCTDGFKGDNCEEEIIGCKSVSCLSEGVCEDTDLGFICNCAVGFTGTLCELAINECAPMPCQNNAVCTDLIGDYSCECQDGFTGKDCEINIDDCIDIVCQNSGTCLDLVNTFSCICTTGWTGEHCDTMINDCEFIECLNNGTCMDLLNDFQCDCMDGFTGEFCETNIDDCFNVSCNNGNCQDLVNDYQCICDLGYTGELCDTMIDDCSGIVCLNGGSCEDKLVNFTCNCVPGYSGRFCEQDIDECAGIVCENNGTCMDMINGFTCLCLDGYTGTHCDINIDDCADSPCQNNGTCIDQVAGYDCQCTDGFEGDNCEQEIDDCEGVNCLSEGVCEDIGLGFICNCAVGYTGTFCELAINECAPMPCQNNAVCTDLIANYSCECQDGFTGRDCEIDIDECAEIECQNGANCTDGIDSFKCLCLPLYSGNLCEVEINLCQEFEPCVNGICSPKVEDGFPSFSCSCVGPYQGPLCNTYNGCLEGFCQNNATCSPNFEDNDYNCTCSQYYFGRNCTSFDSCSFYDGPCQNGGTCYNNEDMSYTCTCPANYTGENCSVEINACYYSPCGENGVCAVRDDLPAGYTCTCFNGYSGINCDINDNANPLGTSGRSYIRANVPVSNVTAIEMKLFSSSPTGLVMLSRSYNQTSYLSLGLEDDVMTLIMVRDSMVAATVQVPMYFVSDNSWHTVLMERYGALTTLTVDKVQMTIEGFEMDLLLDETYFAGVPSYANLPQWESGLNGSISRLVTVDNAELDILASAIETFDIDPSHLPVGVTMSACSYDTCANGGVCTEEDTFRCSCPLGYAGTTCEQDLDIHVTHFTSTSNMAFRNVQPLNDTFTLDFAILPETDSEGIILFVQDADSSQYISLAITGGMLVVHYDLDSDDQQNEPTNISIGDGNWHIISITYNITNLFIEVDSDQQYIMDLEEDSFTPNFSALYIGGLSEVETPPSLPLQNSFTGCIRDLQINGVPKSIIEDSYFAFDIADCPEPECSYVQCANGGTCVNTDNANRFLCSCPVGYDGVYCEIPVDLCDDDTCFNGGSCQEFDNRTYICTCLLETRGRRCEEEFNITLPSFSGNSYIVYPTLPNAISSLSVTITFNATKSDGLLLFNSASNENFADYVSLSLIDSYLIYRYNLGSGNAYINSSTPISLNEWHTVTISRIGRSGFLQVDDQSAVSGESIGSFAGLNIEGDLWFGGFSQFFDISELSGVGTGFSGCMGSLIIQGEDYDMIANAEQGYNIGQCNTSSCAGNPCHNDGTCIEAGNSFVCECSSSGYSGPLCAQDVDLCASTPCMNGGLCQELSNGTDIMCLCPLEYEGKMCNQSAPFVSTPLFSGQSYLRYSLPDITATTTIFIAFKPSSPTGLILYAGDFTRSRDFVSISIVNNHIEFRYDLGSGVLKLTSNNGVSLNTWHMIEARRNGKYGSLVIDDDDIVTGTASGTATLLNAVGDLYIGGVARYAIVSRYTGTELGYTGCVGRVEINGDLDLFNDAKEGRGIKQCDDADPCVSNPCQNGGTCTIGGVAYMYTCSCPIGFAGSDCSEAIDIEIPFLSGNSYLSYPGIENAFAVTIIMLEINPTSPEGLILYNSQFNHILGDYIALVLRNSTIELWLNLGSGSLTISSSPINLSQWHIIEVERMGPNGKLIVDNAVPVTGTAPGSSSMLQLGSDLHIGGISEYSNLAPELEIYEGLSGCVRQLEVQMEVVDILDNLIGSANIGDCSQHLLCLTSPCSNGSTCMDVEPGSYVCICAAGYTGELCDALITECANNPCANNGVCYPEISDGKLLEKCDCSLPYAGENCTERVSFSNASFTGSSYLQFPSNDIPLANIVSHTLVELSIRPYSLNGLLFYIGQTNPSTGDYIMVGLANGTVEFRLDLGSGEGKLSSAEPLVVDQSYMLSILRTDNIGRISISGQDDVTATVPGMARSLNIFDNGNFQLYLGGSPDVSVTSLGSYSAGFSGCIEETVQIGNPSSTLPIVFDSASSGNNVKQCSINTT